MYSLKVRLFILLPTIAVLGMDSLIAAACLNEDHMLHVRIYNG
ncbi:hypothetical protein [Flavobacterium sp. ZB4R12]